MTKPKTLDQLRAEKERAETQLAQEKHKLERLENRKKYLEKGERTKRTHRLCNLGGTIESLAPEVKNLTRSATASGYCPTITICCAAGSGTMPPRRRRKHGTRFSWKPCRNNPMWNICWMCCCSPIWRNGLP